MFGGFNRESRNSFRLHGVRVRYSEGVVEFAAEQVGASVAPNIDLRLSPRGSGNTLLNAAGSVAVDAQGYIRVGRGGLSVRGIVNDGSGGLLLSGTSSVSSGFVIFGNTLRLLQAGADVTYANATNVGSDTNGRSTIVRGGDAWSLSTNRDGGDVRILGGAPSGTGTRGAVALGWDGTNAGPVTVRGTKLSMRGYSQSTANPTTTELPTDGDYGVHKNTSSGTVFLAFNDGGTIRTIAFT